MGNGETCYHCMYAAWDPGLWLRTLWGGFPARATCGNQPDFPGRMRECPPRGICRNFRPKPPTPTGPGVKTIPLGEGFYTYVDAADFEWLNQWTWYLQGGYAVRREKRKYVFMHRQIMQPPEGMVVDHRNNNKLDNTRVNLRVCTQQENACNSSKNRGTSSRFRGVSFCESHRKYRAEISYKGERFPCGYFAGEIEAARARDYKAVELLGEEARLNLPDEWPPERRKHVHAQWLRAQAREKPKEPRPRSKLSKPGNRKSQIGNRKSTAPQGPARKKKAAGKRKRTRKRE